MTRAEILDKMYRDPDVADAIGKMEPAHLRDDLRQEIFTVLCELPEERLLGMHAQGWLKWFLVRTMLNMIKSDRSTFFNKFRRGMDEWNERMEVKDQGEDATEETIAKMQEKMGELHWYASKVMELYADGGNIMKLSRETHIPYRSLLKTVSKTRRKLRTEIMQDEGLKTRRIRLRMVVELEVRADADTDEVMDHIERLDDLAKKALESEPVVRQMTQFRITRTE
jgi:hypothetical protein